MLFIGSASGEVDYALFARLAPAVLKVEAHNPNGSVSIGSGVMVSEGAVVTNCHVTRNASRIDLVKGGARWPVKTQTSDLSHDICILFAPTAAAPVAAISSQEPRVGDSVIALGYVGGLGPRLTVGEVKAVYQLDGGRVIQSTASFSSGASGGGLFDGTGKLIGVIAFKYPGVQAYHFSLPMDWVARSLDIAASREIAPVTGGPAFWQQTGDKQPYFLRAAALEAEGDWQKLLVVAKEWAARDDRNSDAWLMLGKAYVQAKNDERAIEAYQRAVDLDFKNPQAWYAIGAAHGRLQEIDQVQRVHRVLKDIDARLADELFRNYLAQ